MNSTNTNESCILSSSTITTQNQAMGIVLVICVANVPDLPLLGPLERFPTPPPSQVSLKDTLLVCAPEIRATAIPYRTAVGLGGGGGTEHE